MNSFEALARELKIKFKNLEILKTALTHRSYLNEHRQIKESNERLEFLGDAVLEVVVSSYLFDEYPQKTEGVLTSLRAKIVQTKTLARVSRELNLNQYLLLSKGEKEGGGANNESLLADVFEALVGAIFVDQGLRKAAFFINLHLLKKLKTILTSREVVDYKSQYQEKVQAQDLKTPVYKIISQSGPDHNRTFVAAVLVEGKLMARGEGKSKQLAEQQAARHALEKLTKKE
jgi:ribonuclease-3